MANAKRCDRCGSFYSLSETGKQKYTLTLTNTRTKVDLCDKCNKEITKWMTKFNKEGANNEEGSSM